MFELATRKSSDLVINSDMTVELQSLSTQFVLPAGDDAQRPSSGDCSELSRKRLCRSVAQVAKGANLALVSGTGQCCNRC